jgi:hypothetical protein
MTFMKKLSASVVAAACLGISSWATVLTGPFDPEQWPATLDVSKTVHFVVTDGGLTSPGNAWSEGLSILTGGDQVTADIAIGGHTGKKVTGAVLNIADSMYGDWADDEFIDILVQAYGDAALYNAQGQPRNFNFLTGVLPELKFPIGGQVPPEAKNKKWNWILFRIPNGIRAFDGSRLVGSIPANAQGASTYAGVNGGTIRFESASGLIVRVVAFGAQGAFGAPEDINKFFPAESCASEPDTNLAGIDIAAGVTNRLVVINNGDQTVVYDNAVGPVSDKRRAVRPEGTFLNFGIEDNYLGLPCNDPRAVKVCLDIYDAPEFAGLDVRFGPEAYATDDKGGISIYPAEKRHTLQGSGKWVRRSWTIPAVNLKGVNAGSLTAGPRFASDNGQVFVSRFEIAILRTGTNSLAGQDPLAGCYEDPIICTDQYGNFAELDLAKDIRNGLDVGTSSGDQEMIVAEAGPANDRRMAVRPAQDEGAAGVANQFLNFAIIGEALGPSSQPPALVAICIEYYDDPALAGTRIKPEVYVTERNGVQTFGYTPDSYFVTLEGSNQWRTAYWEISDMKFSGVNQTPQAAARFTTANAGDVRAKIAVTRVRYAVIRPCGTLAGVNLLAGCKPVIDVSLSIERFGDNVRISWISSAAGFALQESSTLLNPQWTSANAAMEIANGRNVATLPVGKATQYFRLAK